MSDDEIQEAQPSTSAVAATQNASVTVINQHLNIAPFQLTKDRNDTAVRWAKWKKNIERQFRVFDIEDPQLKKDGLIIIYGGQEIADLDDSIPDPILEGEQNEYIRLIAKLDQHFCRNRTKITLALNSGTWCNMTTIANQWRLITPGLEKSLRNVVILTRTMRYETTYKSNAKQRDSC